MKRREIEVFSLSFLDVICCGFGAIILMVMLLTAQVVTQRAGKVEDLQKQLEEVTKDYEAAREKKLKLKRQSAAAAAAPDTDAALKQVENQIEGLSTQLNDAQRQAQSAGTEAKEREDAIKSLAKAKIALENAKRILESKPAAPQDAGSSTVEFAGQGRRQYLTGLKLDGDRTLILVDTSASMLDETIVSIVRRKNGSEASRRDAPKWRRAVASTHWLIANLKAGKQFQVYFFNTEARPAVVGTDGRWLDTNDTQARTKAVAALQAAAPDKGTSLHRAFAVARGMNPAPDSIILLTDGLPTQALSPSATNTVSGDERLKLFEGARGQLPAGVPVNTLLFPIEGDPAAAEAFWRLAIATRGSLITPARNWP